MNTIIEVTPTICALMGIEPPELSATQPIETVIEAASGINTPGKIDRCMIFCPDAIGASIIDSHPAIFNPVDRIANVRIPVRSVIPPKTPVCFASMFSGARPEEHGITWYQKPILVCDTIFDSLVRAGKSVAIVAHTDSSIDLIFRSREIEYYSEPNDALVTKRVVDLLNENRHDVILAYQQQYDDILHRSRHDSAEALEALKAHVQAFEEIADAWNRAWAGQDRMILFAPDHGAHFDEELGKSNHSEDIPEDMNVYHYYGFRASKRL